ncbi:MAG: PqqD family protein [Bacteroidaceae bacterium]|nr:PqqD family protein [Bacteroidaceae bacterium]
MRIKPGFELRTICGQHIVVSKGIENIDFNRIISLNDSAVSIWKAVEGTDFTPADMAAVLRKEYEVDEATALADANELAEAWKKAGLCE